MKFDIKINEQDYIAFNKYYLRSSNVIKKTKNIVTFAMLGLCAILVFMFFYFNSFDTLIVPIVESVIICLFIFAYLLYFRTHGINRSISNTIKRMKKDGKLPFEEESIVEFTDNMMHDKSKTTELKIEYDNIEKIIKTNKYLFVFIDSARATIIPIEQLGDDKDKVINLLQDKVDKQKIINM